MEALHVRVLKADAIVAEFDVRADDPAALQDQLQAACVAAESLGYASATIEDLGGETVQLPTQPDSIEVSRPATARATS